MRKENINSLDETASNKLNYTVTNELEISLPQKNQQPQQGFTLKNVKCEMLKIKPKQKSENKRWCWMGNRRSEWCQQTCAILKSKSTTKNEM